MDKLNAALERVGKSDTALKAITLERDKLAQVRLLHPLIFESQLHASVLTCRPPWAPGAQV